MGQILDVPTCVGSVCGTVGANGNWYGIRNIQLAAGETKKYCAPVHAPQVLSSILYFVEFELFNEYNQACGNASIKVIPPHPTQEVFQGLPSYSSGPLYSSNAWDPENQVFDPLGNPAGASPGTYAVEIHRPLGDPYDYCNAWRVAWQATW